MFDYSKILGDRTDVADVLEWIERWLSSVLKTGLSAQRVHFERDPTVIELLHQVTHCNTTVELFLVPIEASEQEERFWAIWWGSGGRRPPGNFRVFRTS